jgi:diguanylate cyclase (GGDEF)-like protein/PAS domain S-box-containing protein
MLRLVLPVASGEVAEALTPADFQSRPRLANIEKDEVSAIRAIDEATSLLLGWSEAEMVGKRTLEFIHPDDHPRAIDNWMEMIAHGVRHAVRLRYRTKDGDWLWLETSNELSHDESGRRRVACQMIDISEEMAAVEALRYSEQVLRRMAETVPVGLGEIAPDQSFRYTNSTFRALLGREEVGSLDEVLAGVDPADAALLEQAVGAALRSGSDADVDVRLSSTASAPERMCRVALRPVVDDGQVLGALICVMDVTDLKLQAATDPLTGLHNRSAIFEALRQALTAEGPVGVVFLDVDQFKSINDNFGHDAGDAALTRLADALRGAVRKGDLVGRVGGDEFLVVCRAVASAEDLIEVSRRIQEEAVAALGDGNGSRFSRASVGVALVAAGSISAEDAVARADAAMYHAKRRPEAGPVLWSDELSLGASAAGH